MSTGLIIAIIVVAVIVIALLVMLPRMRAAADRRKAERELLERREAAAGEQRAVASERETRAERAEEQARIAASAAEREREQASAASERAEMHEQGRADHELIEPDERDRFAGIVDTEHEHADAPAGTADRDADGHTLDDRARAATGRDDEQRFERSRITDDVRDSDRTGR